MSYIKYEKEQGPVPQYEIAKELSDLTLMFIISSIIYFLIGGSLAIIMRIIQSKHTQGLSNTYIKRLQKIQIRSSILSQSKCQDNPSIKQY
jgi:hypothetical protein